MENEMRFSSALQISDLNDFITPSQACIKPEKTKELRNGESVKSKVEISLGDCLACSGCITSAESVLIEMQSYHQLYKMIELNQSDANNATTIVISLSLQSIASIAAKYDMNMKDCAEKLVSFFKQIGVHYVFDISLARHLCLIEAQRELIESFNRSEFPVLTSVCPGWVCYVEKTHSQLIPLLSKVKSPQQIMGVLLNNMLKNKLNCNRVYHVSIMPCYDKKLEASRNEFNQTCDDFDKEVDCVLTPIEIEVMLSQQNIILSDLNNQKLDSLIPDLDEQILSSHLGSGSGGYVENLFIFMATKYFNNYFSKGQKLNYKTIRNRDFIELNLENELGDKLLSFAIVNGFRNIQTLVQRIKRKCCHYQYVEVMACPNGCLNGGAQLRIDKAIQNDLLEKVEKLYKSLPITTLPVDCEHEKITDLYIKCFGNSDKYENLRTTFKAVEKTKNLLNINSDW